MARRDLLLLALIVIAALGIRTWPAWNAVFDARATGFLETDAWYHVRLVENQARNYPWRVTMDPYAAPGGQFVPIAPLFDTITATIVVIAFGRDATTAEVERVAAFMPPVFGALAIVAVWALASFAFDRRAGLIAAALLAVLPGHFLDRTMLGFVDHHALEALLAIAVLLALARGLRSASLVRGLSAGAALGAYLLAWASGAFLVAIVGAWIAVYAVIGCDRDELAAAAKTTAIASLTALALVLLFQDPRMYRYGSQIVALAGLAALAAAVRALGRHTATLPRGRLILAAAGALAAAALVALLVARDTVMQLMNDVARLTPNPARMGVLEARPLFLYPGEWSWAQPWDFFRTGFFIAIAALVPLLVRVHRQRRAVDVLLLVFTVVTLAATLGQNRFGYYFVPAAAILGGFLATMLLDWSAGSSSAATSRARPLARDLAIVAIAGGMFAPNLAPGTLLAPRASSFPAYWRDTMQWLRMHTPPPFAQAAGARGEFYEAHYGAHAAVPADYSVMNWWDHGYWIVQAARRVPVSNPTQVHAPAAAQFYSATDEAEAMALLVASRARFVVADWELPFRRVADGSIMGRFQSVVDWAGGDHAAYYEIVYRREGDDWTPVWIFHEPYYRSMAFRLVVLGGEAAEPAHATSVITTTERVDATGLRFRALLTEQTYPTYEAAQAAAAQLSVSAEGDVHIVGLDPWRAAFPIMPVRSLVQRFAARTAVQKPTEGPWVRVFEVQ